MGGITNNEEWRGKIVYRNRAKQLVDFSGLRYGKITPTDIDGFLDFENKLFVWIEVKSTGVDMPYGQRLALERMANAAHRSGIVAWVLLATHDTPSEMDIDVASCNVVSAFNGGRWYNVSAGATVKSAIDFLYAQNITNKQ